MKEERKKVTIGDYMKECELQMLGCTHRIDGTRVNAAKVLMYLLEDNGFWATPEVRAITDRYVIRDYVPPKTDKNQPPKKMTDLIREFVKKLHNEEYGTNY
ncbi:MAG: hypothetical protein WBK97_07405 [Bacteroidales bacterium]|jgi:hypothetical protein